MSENGFEPFSPRRLQRVIEESPDAEVVAILEASHAPDAAFQPAAIAAQAVGCSAATGSHVDIQTSPQPEVTTVGDAIETSHTDGALDGARIRAAAIGLAATACARALRYAVDRNPRLLARFVDDALRAAGSPRHAIVRLAPSVAISAREQSDHDYVADATLAPGDVFVDCADGTLGSTIEQRAEGLVRAAAS